MRKIAQLALVLALILVSGPSLTLAKTDDQNQTGATANSSNLAGTTGATVSLPADQCRITTGSSSQACSAAITSTSSTDAVRSDPGSAAVPIDVHGACRYVDNVSANSMFVPFRSAAEWAAFYNSANQHFSLVTCARPATLTVSPDKKCVSPKPASLSFSLPYDRTGATEIRSGSFQCTLAGQSNACGTGASQTWTENVTVTYTAQNGDVSVPPTNTGNPSWSQAVTYSAPPAASPAPACTPVFPNCPTACGHGASSISLSQCLSSSGTSVAFSNCSPTSTSCPATANCNCSPSSVANGSIGAYPTCAISCNAGYTLSGSSCVASTCSPASVANGSVGAYPGCAISCNSGYTLSNGSCVAVPPSTCSPSSVANGSIGAYPTCAISCNAGYTLSGSSCVASTCSPASVANGSVGAYPGCAISCNSGYTLSNGSCVAIPPSTCSPASLTHGSVGPYPGCAITCYAGYIQHGNSCAVATCSPASIANGSVGAYPGCAISCNSGYTLSNGSCVALTCNPASVAHGSIGAYPGCGISCNAGYIQSGNSCVAVSCNPASVANGSVGAYPTCAISCNAGYVKSGNSCIVAPTPVNGACGRHTVGDVAADFNCDSGSSGNVVNTGCTSEGMYEACTYTYQCIGSNGGTTANCSDHGTTQ